MPELGLRTQTVKGLSRASIPHALQVVLGQRVKMTLQHEGSRCSLVRDRCDTRERLGGLHVMQITVHELQHAGEVLHPLAQSEQVLFRLHRIDGDPLQG